MGSFQHSVSWRKQLQSQPTAMSVGPRPVTHGHWNIRGSQGIFLPKEHLLFSLVFAHPSAPFHVGVRIPANEWS